MIDEFDISMLDVTDFPFHGAFYTFEIDDDKPLDQRVPEEVLVFETDCDIQKNSRLHNGSMIGADYSVYFPLPLNPDSDDTSDKYGPVMLRRGMIFRGTGYGYTYEGEVEIVRMSQLGGCSVDIKVTTESEL